MSTILTLALLCVGMPARAESKAQVAPLFSLEVMQGEDVGVLEQHRGKVVILEFWATYCGWCKATHPKLANFAEENPDVVVLGITAQKKSRVRKYLRKTNTGFTILHDPKAKVSRDYRAKATPTLVVIDREGVVRAWGQGGNKLKPILQATRELLAAAN